MGSLPLLIKFFALAFSALLPLVNPLGSALMLLDVVGPLPAAIFRGLARSVAIRMTIFLLVVELIGTSILEFFGISLPVVQVAGGLVLASMGWSLLDQKAESPKPDAGDVEEAGIKSLSDMIFYPLTFPLTVGPGCIVVMLTLSAHASASHGVLRDVMAHLGISLAVVALSVTVLISYRYAPQITQRISVQTVRGILRIVAFVLLCIGVQITWNGVEALIKSVLKS
jgi:multiple antibiotic resistance protein